ncbi:hypothetical protein AVEN_267965-1 [Araneus ventricosus]|uniref:Uncharacterized protein n=1 Tax=Araneus ventricosus TaxID=182803 RepID=A0A4Y1ZJV5_ARAVE|nr:hypothetical protein AVEN_267965-1 [Araneus ventricosus]
MPLNVDLTIGTHPISSYSSALPKNDIPRQKKNDSKQRVWVQRCGTLSREQNMWESEDSEQKLTVFLAPSNRSTWSLWSTTQTNDIICAHVIRHGSVNTRLALSDRKVEVFLTIIFMGIHAIF